MPALILLQHIAAAEPHTTSPTASPCTHARRVLAQSVMFTHQPLESCLSFFFFDFLCMGICLHSNRHCWWANGNFTTQKFPRAYTSRILFVSEMKLVCKGMFDNTVRREREKKIVFREGSCLDIRVFFPTVLSCFFFFFSPYSYCPWCHVIVILEQVWASLCLTFVCVNVGLHERKESSDLFEWVMTTGVESKTSWRPVPAPPPILFALFLLYLHASFLVQWLQQLNIY